MGLSGVKKKSKLSHDPNNTAWAKSTSNFGHKILSRQGWKPGDYLGAENATHSEHYTAANASHIRVLLREDNLGIGAQVGKGNAETFGLSMFSGLLGRLNGKSDGEVQKQQSAIRDAELRTYTGQKYGFMNFVSGGLLIGDKIEPKSATSSTRKRKSSEEPEQDVSERAEKKQKRISESRAAAEPAKSKKSASKKEKKGSSKVSAEEVKEDTTASSDSEDEDNDREKTGKKVSRKTKMSKTPEERDEKARLKEEKRARKEERRRRKEEKRKKRALKDSESQESPLPSTLPSESEGTATPPVQQVVYGGRQAVRQRYIQQKRMASMDPQALKEIFMLQAKAAA